MRRAVLVVVLAALVGCGEGAGDAGDAGFGDVALDHDALVISIAAGVTIAGIEARLRPGTRVVRTMPNVCSLVREGATALAAGTHATDSDLEVARRIFDSVGLSVVVDEGLMDAVTGLSGSGPAYIFMVIEALSDAGVKAGLSRVDSHALACQTVLGAAKLAIESRENHCTIELERKLGFTSRGIEDDPMLVMLEATL